MALMDPKRIVADGYDAVHSRYVEWGSVHGNRRQQAIVEAQQVEPLDTGDRALDLGCGTGELATATLIARGFDVTGVDISAASIARARTLFPSAVFLVGDMATISLPRCAYRLITAFFSIIHVPRDEHAHLFARVREWLTPGGVFVATLGTGRWEGSDDDWLGAPMYWSNWDAETNVALLQKAGLDVLRADVETEVEDGVPVSFLWVCARRPSGD